MDELNYNEMLGTPVAQLRASSLSNPKMNSQMKQPQIRQFAKNMEMDLLNYTDDDSMSDVSNYKLKQKKYKPSYYNFFNFSKFKDYDMIVLVIVFFILNTNQSINFINENLKYIKSLDVNYVNLITRSLIFGILFYLVKKFI
jgi:hypothetical protein